jgi:hypothetical protein
LKSREEHAQLCFYLQYELMLSQISDTFHNFMKLTKFFPKIPLIILEIHKLQKNVELPQFYKINKNKWNIRSWDFAHAAPFEKD